MTDNWAAAGSAANDVYLGGRLTYRSNTDESDKAFWRTGTQAVRSAFIGILVIGTALAILFALIAVILVVVLRVDLLGLGVIAIPAAYVLAALIPERDWVSQWELTLDGKAEAAESTYAAIIRGVKERNLPVSVKVRRIRAGAGTGIGNYLVIHRGRFTVYVGVMAFGTGLFVTWSMWRHMSRGRTIWQWMRETAAGLVGRGSIFHQTIRSDPDRALREAIHNVAREGVEAAIAGATISLAEFGGDVPVEDPNEGTWDSDQPYGSPGAGYATPVAPPRPVAPPSAAIPPRPVAPPARPVTSPSPTTSAPALAAPVAVPLPVAQAPVVTPTAPEVGSQEGATCPSCGAAWIPGAVFCVACGNRPAG